MYFLFPPQRIFRLNEMAKHGFISPKSRRNFGNAVVISPKCRQNFGETKWIRSSILPKFRLICSKPKGIVARDFRPLVYCISESTPYVPLSHTLNYFQIWSPIRGNIQIWKLLLGEIYLQGYLALQKFIESHHAYYSQKARWRNSSALDCYPAVPSSNPVSTQPTCSMEWKCSTFWDMQYGHEHTACTWTCSMDWPYSIHVHVFAACPCPCPCLCPCPRLCPCPCLYPFPCLCPCPCCMFMSELHVYVRVACSGPCSTGIDMQHGLGHVQWHGHGHAAWRWTFRLKWTCRLTWTCSMDKYMLFVNVLHVHVNAARPCPCCMPMFMPMLYAHVHTAHPSICCMFMSMLRLCICCMSMSLLHVHVHQWTLAYSLDMDMRPGLWHAQWTSVYTLLVLVHVMLLVPVHVHAACLCSYCISCPCCMLL